MADIKYLLRRIKGMNYKNFFKKIDKVHNKNRKNKFLIFLDVVYCGLRYQSGYVDYELFAMYNLNAKQRKTILTRGINNAIVKKLNNPEYNVFFSNKVEFNRRFNKYLNREWLYLNNNFAEFDNFLKNKKEIFCKPLDLSCGSGIEKIKIKDKDSKELYEYLLKNKQLLIEEVAVQHKEMSGLHPSSINTVRVVTINNGKFITVVAAFLRIGNNNRVVDNFNSGGMTSKVDVKDGMINFPALDKNDLLYNEHPMTGKKIKGFKIPMWDEVKKMCEEAAKNIPEIGYVAWDVCIGPKKPYLIEGNEFPGHDLYQLPPHRENNMGIYPIFKEAMERGIKNENRNYF